MSNNPLYSETMPSGRAMQQQGLRQPTNRPRSLLADARRQDSLLSPPIIRR